MKFKELEKLVEKNFEKEKRGAAHDFTHIQRVMKNCELKRKKEKANLKILKYAALLHDYVREAAHETNGNHALESSKKARQLLKKTRLTKKEIDEICHAIEAHSRSSNVKPKTLEAKVLFDADKLDAAGYYGFLRWIIQADELNWSIDKAIEAYFKAADKTLKEGFYTKTGTKLIRQRASKIKKKVRQIKNQLKQEK